MNKIQKYRQFKNISEGTSSKNYDISSIMIDMPTSIADIFEDDRWYIFEFEDGTAFMKFEDSSWNLSAEELVLEKENTDLLGTVKYISPEIDDKILKAIKNKYPNIKNVYLGEL